MAIIASVNGQANYAIYKPSLVFRTQLHAESVVGGETGLRKSGATRLTGWRPQRGIPRPAPAAFQENVRKARFKALAI